MEGPLSLFMDTLKGRRLKSHSYLRASKEFPFLRLSMHFKMVPWVTSDPTHPHTQTDALQLFASSIFYYDNFIDYLPFIIWPIFDLNKAIQRGVFIRTHCCCCCRYCCSGSIRLMTKLLCPYVCVYDSIYVCVWMWLICHWCCCGNILMFVD